MINFGNIRLSRFFVGSDSIQTILSGVTTLHGDYVQPSTSITLNYTPVEYISNEDSSQFIWFPFDFYWSNSAKCQFKVDYTAKAGGQIIGDYGSSNDSTDVRWFKDRNNTMYFDVMTGRIQSTQSQSMFELELGNYYVKNLQNNSNIVTGSAYNIQKRTSPFGVFGNTNDRGKIYYVKLYEGDTLVRDLIPVLDSNNTPCFFDKINNNFYYNTKTGTPQYANAGQQSGITINYNTELTTLTYDTPSGIIDTKINLNASANTGVELIYSSDDTSIATVDSNGQISPKASGTTTITIIAPTTTIGNTTYRGVQKRLQIECNAPSSYVELLNYIDTNFDDGLHFYIPNVHFSTTPYRAEVRFNGQGCFDVYLDASNGGKGYIWYIEKLMNSEGTDMTDYYIKDGSGNNCKHIKVENLPDGEYKLQVYGDKNYDYYYGRGHFTL